MSVETAANAAYLVAALLFILSLAGLSKHETARRGLTFGITGMALALVATVALVIDHQPATIGIVLMVVAVAIGAVIGLMRARSVQMTEMPELIALLHSFVGLAAVLVGWNGYLHVEGFDNFERNAFDKRKIRAGMRKVGLLITQRAQMNLVLGKGQECYPVNRTGTTVVMATHDADIVNQMRKRVIELEAGDVVRDQNRGVYGAGR